MIFDNKFYKKQIKDFFNNETYIFKLIVLSENVYALKGYNFI